MSTWTRLGLLGASIAAVAIGALATRPTDAGASDHNEPQSINAISDDVASDAADIYGNFAWPTDDSVVFAVTFPSPYWGFEYLNPEGPQADRKVWDETQPNAYDDGVLYSIHVDRDWGDVLTRNAADAELSIHARFGYDAENRKWGVMVEGIPGERDPVVVPVGETWTGESGAKVQAGLFDEPFFVDLERFFEGQQVPDPERPSSAHLEFRADTDFFAGQNVHAIVIEIPKDEVATRIRRNLGVWTTTHRIAGDPHIRPGNECQ